MAFKLGSKTPFYQKDEDKKVTYNTNIFGGANSRGSNTYEKDSAQLKSEPYKFGSSNSYASIRANKRMTSFKKRGGQSPVTPPASTSSGRGGTYGNIDTPKTTTNNSSRGGSSTPVTPRSGREGGNGSSTPVTPPVVTPPVVQPKKKTSFKSAYDKRDKKVYGNLSQSQFTAESKRQIASKKAGKGYDAPKKQMGKVRKKVEAVKPMKAAGSDVKKQTPKLAGDVRTKAQKLRAKGEGILANKKLSTRQKQKQSGAVRKQYDAEMATQKKKKPVVEVKKKEVVKKKKNERFMF